MWIPAEEYNTIKKSFPIPCVDLIIKNERNEILLVKRKNEPAKNEWWFPGGRILFGETRNDAAIRKLKEECGIVADKPIEWKTVDIFLQDNEEHYNSHGISTFFIFTIISSVVKLDEQSSDFAWKDIHVWNNTIKHEFVTTVLKEFYNFSKQQKSTSNR